MSPRRWRLPLAVLLFPLAGCVHAAEPPRPHAVAAEALTDANSIRQRCEDPEGVLAGRTLCVLKDLPRDAAVKP